MTLSTRGAMAVAAAFIVAAAAAGLAGARLSQQRAASSAPVAPTTAPPAAATATAASPAAGAADPFAQPLAAGCATARSVWVVADGGAIARYDGARWAVVDPTLRSLVAIACDTTRAIAVGPAGRALTFDDVTGRVAVDSLGIEDLYAVSLTPDGAFVAGGRGTVLRQDAAGWATHARGIDEDLLGVIAFGERSAFVVGTGGAAYRLEAAGWRPLVTGTTSTLRALVAPNAEFAVAAGDNGTLLVWDGSWRPIASGVRTPLRAATRIGGAIWVAGEQGVLLVLDAAGGDHTVPRPAVAQRVDLGTTCTLRSVFARGSELWIVGSDAGRAAVWRRTGSDTQKWGDC